MRNRTEIVIVILVALIFLGMTGCFYEHHRHHNDDSIVGSGRIQTQERTVEPCRGVQIVGSAKVFLRQDAQQSIRVEADDNIIDRVVTRYENGNLVVGLEEGSYAETTVDVYVSLAEIENVEIIGAGDITSRNSLQCGVIRCHISGAGNISLDGTADAQTVVIDGAGNVSNFGLITARTSAVINGTGECDVTATQHFDGVINGVGSIVYDGHPAEVQSSVNGIGRIVPR
jgi:hypothetical protein